MNNKGDPVPPLDAMFEQTMSEAASRLDERFAKHELARQEASTIPGFKKSGFDLNAIGSFSRQQLKTLFRAPQFNFEFRIGGHQAAIVSILNAVADAMRREGQPAFAESLPGGLLYELKEALLSDDPMIADEQSLDDLGNEASKEYLAHVSEHRRQTMCSDIVGAAVPFLLKAGIKEREHPRLHEDAVAFAIWKCIAEEFLPGVPATSTELVVELYHDREGYPAMVRETLVDDIGVMVDPGNTLGRSEWSTVRDFTTFMNMFGENGLRVLLATSLNPEARTAIFDIARRLHVDVAKLLFRSCAELTRAAENMREVIHDSLPADAFPSMLDEYSASIEAEQYIRRKADALLIDAAARARAAPVEYNIDPIDPRGTASVALNAVAERLMLELSLLRSSVAARAAAFRALSERGIIRTLEDAKGFEMRTFRATELAPKMQTEMSAIFSANRSSYPERLRSISEREFSALLSGSGQFYVLEFAGEIVAFMRFEERADGSLYAGSLNVRPEARGSAIGSAMLLEVLVELGRDRDIVAEAYSKNPMLKHYQDDWGFKITGETPDWHGSGELFYEMRRPAGGESMKKVA